MSNYELINAKPEEKVQTLDNSMVTYFIKCFMAGIYLAIGCLTYWKLYDLFGNSGTAKFISALVFPIGLNLILITKTELFTSNNMFMFWGILHRKISLKKCFKLWSICWVGNFLGSILIAVMAYLAGAFKSGNLEFMIHAAEKKVNYDITSLFFKAVLANFIVCLAVFVYFQLEKESSKIFMLFFTIATFLILGFEHSIANMGTFSFWFFTNSSFSLSGSIYNLTIATAGNIIGGCFFALLIYLKEDRVRA